MKSFHHRCQHSGSTLIELLTVIAVIVILASISALAFGFITRKAASKRAEVQMTLLDDALIRYHADTGVYPVAMDGSGMAMYYVLWGDGVGPDGIRGTADDGPLDGRPDAGATVYLEQLNPATNPMGLVEGPTGGVPTRLVDPFGNSWHYGGGEEHWPQLHNQNFDIHSPGADGEGSPLNPGADDLRNW